MNGENEYKGNDFLKNRREMLANALGLILEFLENKSLEL
jgi:hypothetical protein